MCSDALIYITDESMFQNLKTDATPQTLQKMLTHDARRLFLEKTCFVLSQHD